MKDLYKITATTAIDNLIEDVMADQESLGAKVTKAEARTLVLNALMYNVVSCEVCNQVRYLRDQDIE